MAERAGRAWRWVFDSLRAAVEPASLVPQLLSHAPSLLHSCSEIPPHQVATDVSLLVQLVADRWLPVDGGDAARICCATCNLVSETSSRLQLEFTGHSLLALLHFFQGTIVSASAVVVLEEEGGADASKAKVEAVAALGQVVHDNGGHLPMDEVSLLVLFLLGLITHPAAAPAPVRSPSAWSGSQPDAPGGLLRSRSAAADEMEVQRLAFVALGSLFSSAGPVVSNETWKSIVLALRTVLELVASKASLTEDSESSRYYGALLRCVHLLLSESKGSLEEHVGPYVGLVRMFFTYGLSGSQGKTTYGASTRKEAGGAYRPPHLRGKLKPQAPTNGATIGFSDDLGPAWGFSSDSDQSDSDGSVGDNDRYKSSKPRTHAIMIIQVLARADPKSLHAHWALLLPTHDVLQPRPYQATLLTTLLFDPIVKARVAAASTIAVMLEGPVRAFLQVAEHRELARKAPFTTLSGSLGQIVIQLHTGLVHVVLNEKQSSVLVATLKALSLLVAAAPFNRLPAELLPNVVLSMSKRTRELFTCAVDQSSTMSAAISCLGVALSATPASSDVAAILSAKVAAGMSDAASRPPHTLLLDLISYTQPPAPAAVRVEAFQALKAAVHNYSGVVASFWDQIFDVVAGVVDMGSSREAHLGATQEAAAAHAISAASLGRGVPPAGSAALTARLSDDKLVHSAIKLLDEVLRVISGSEVPSEAQEDGPLKPPSPSVVPKPLKLLGGGGGGGPAATSGSGRPVMEFEQSEDGRLQWLLTLERLLPGVLRHSAPMVRGAALTCFAGLTPVVFCALPAPKQEFILSAVMRASQEDDTPAVRSAACRAVGVIVGFPQVSKSKDKVTPIINLVLSRMEDASAAVRITASWALANLCDALRSNVETVNPTEAEQILEGVPLAFLAECTFKAAKNGDKVRANAVRALGNLARFVNFSTDPTCGPCGNVDWKRSDYLMRGHELFVDSRPIQAPASQWLGTMVQTFVSCVTTGNVKVQWNVCHALGNLFLNRSIRLSTAAWAPSVFSILLLLLRGSANFKIRIHAASALAVPASREDYGVAFGDVMQTLVHALDFIDGDSAGSGPTSFKYQAALKDQLTLTTLHVLALGHPQDFTILKDMLLKRASFLNNWLSTVLFATGGRGAAAAATGAMPEAAAFGTWVGTAAVAGTSLEYDEKPLPLPGHQRGGFRYDDDNAAAAAASGGEAALQRLVDAQAAVRALSAMYMYGGSIATAQNLQTLI